MKARTILITTFILLIIIELISTANLNKTKLSKKSKRFMEGGEEEEGEEEIISTKIVTTNIVIETTTEISKPTESGEESKENKGILDFDQCRDVVDSILKYEICKDVMKPSTAFTIILMIYLVLIIAGAILVLVLLKKDLEQ